MYTPGGIFFNLKTKGNLTYLDILNNMDEP
jgi:hypothetical protein